MKKCIVNKLYLSRTVEKLKSALWLNQWVIIVGIFSLLLISPSQAHPQKQAPTLKPNQILKSALKNFEPIHAIQKNKNGVYKSPDVNFILTIHPQLQEHVQKTLNQYEVPQAALVAIEPQTGRILAYVSHSLDQHDAKSVSKNKNTHDLALDATPPAASVFKVVTGATLIGKGIKPDQKLCYGGGFRKVILQDLTDNPKRDKTCASLAQAMGSSINTIFAKFADRHLSKTDLHQYASAFGFGHALPFDVPTQVSQLEVPNERLEFARTAAGFWHMHMSPLHGALIAATIANHGNMMRPTLIKKINNTKGKVLYKHSPELFRAVIPKHHAKAVTKMMELTVTKGTAKKSFFDPAGKPFLPGIRIAGKTGTLTGTKPYRGYSWWVGFAPANKPKIAVAALIINEPKWRIKSSYLAREALRIYLTKTKTQKNLSKQ